MITFYVFFLSPREVVFSLRLAFSKSDGFNQHTSEDLPILRNGTQSGGNYVVV